MSLDAKHPHGQAYPERSRALETENVATSVTSAASATSAMSVASVASATSDQPATHLPWAKCEVGDVFTFGNYPQTATGEIKPIEWRVLRRDDDGLLVISKYALEGRSYHEGGCDITWSQCTLRQWLNGEFINKAFSDSERKHIKEMHLLNPNSPIDWRNIPGGPATDDRVFLLSHDEAIQLFASDEDRKCQVTEYAIANGVYVDEEACGGICFWWLRSPGLNQFSAAGVYYEGNISYSFVEIDNNVVRPAFKIAL